MDRIEDMMTELDGADPKTVNRIAWEKGSLPVRLAMLGLASTKKGDNPLWWGYPPGVFISYKWDGEPMRDLVLEVAEHVRGLGYEAFLDVENLDQDADAYFQIPQFIASLQKCTFYVLLLTELSADLMTGRKGKTSWIHDEHQHALRLANSGRLFIVPVLLESGGTTESYTLDNVLDLTHDRRAFGALDDILAAGPIALSQSETQELRAAVGGFDSTFLQEQWDAAADLLQSTEHLGHTFDHKFRRMLHSMYTGDRPGLETALDGLHAVYGQRLVSHLYGGYCVRHGIPNQSSA